MEQLCIQKTSPSANMMFQRNKLHLYLTLTQKKVKTWFSWPRAFIELYKILSSIRSGGDIKLHISNISRQHPWPHVNDNRFLIIIKDSEIWTHCQNLLDDPSTFVSSYPTVIIDSLIYSMFALKDFSFYINLKINGQLCHSTDAMSTKVPLQEVWTFFRSAF